MWFFFFFPFFIFGFIFTPQLLNYTCKCFDFHIWSISLLLSWCMLELTQLTCKRLALFIFLHYKLWKWSSIFIVGRGEIGKVLCSCTLLTNHTYYLQYHQRGNNISLYLILLDHYDMWFLFSSICSDLVFSFILLPVFIIDEEINSNFQVVWVPLSYISGPQKNHDSAG